MRCVIATPANPVPAWATLRAALVLLAFACLPALAHGAGPQERAVKLEETNANRPLPRGADVLAFLHPSDNITAEVLVRSAESAADLIQGKISDVSGLVNLRIEPALAAQQLGFIVRDTNSGSYYCGKGKLSPGPKITIYRTEGEEDKNTLAKGFQMAEAKLSRKRPAGGGAGGDAASPSPALLAAQAATQQAAAQQAAAQQAAAQQAAAQQAAAQRAAAQGGAAGETPVVGRPLGGTSGINPPPEKKPNWLRRFGTFVGDMIANILFFLCWVVLVSASPVLFFLALREHRKWAFEVQGFRQQLADATQQIRNLECGVERLAARQPAERSAAEEPEAEAPRQRRLAIRVPEKTREAATPMQEQFVPEIPAPPKATSENLGRAFVEWCTMKGNSSIQNIGSFATFVQGKMGDVRLRALFRDRNAGTENFIFTSRADHAGDATEYWFAKVEGDNILLPRPEYDGFCELAPVFEVAGSRVPQTMREIEPGILDASDESTFTLKRMGRVW
jgi:hypothetical protein